MTLIMPLRPWLLLASGLAWLWAASAFTPWAADPAPRLWLYDTLFYLRYALLFWAAAEALHLAFHWREPVARRTALPMALALFVAIAAWTAAHTEAGLRIRVLASARALDSLADRRHVDGRVRTGHFIVDSVRTPCPGQTWLWLGRPYGGGTGTNLALVRAPALVPHTPRGPAFRFWQVDEAWWLAYQHAAHYHRDTPGDIASTCAPGRTVQRHRDGARFVDDGRRALHER
jgi:hypothetical protein